MRRALAVAAVLVSAVSPVFAQAESMPAFDGLDPTALADGQRVEGDPSIATRVGGDTLHFANEDSRRRWLRDEETLAPKALHAWGESSGDAHEELAFALARRAQNHNLSKSGLAIGGRDPVTYFPEGGSGPKKGREPLEVEYSGATYRFVNEQNLGRFLENPARYEPAYGGWCAYAMAQGDQVEVDLDDYIVTDDGRLLLFYRDFFNNTRKKWIKSKKDLTPDADSHWLEQSGETARGSE